MKNFSIVAVVAVVAVVVVAIVVAVVVVVVFFVVAVAAASIDVAVVHDSIADGGDNVNVDVSDVIG